MIASVDLTLHTNMSITRFSYYILNLILNYSVSYTFYLMGITEHQKSPTLGLLLRYKFQVLWENGSTYLLYVNAGNIY